MIMNSFVTLVGITTCVMPFCGGTTVEDPLVVSEYQMSTTISGNDFSLSSSISPSIPVVEAMPEDNAYLNEYDEDIDFEPRWERIPVTLEVVKVSNFVPEFELEDVYEEL